MIRIKAQVIKIIKKNSEESNKFQDRLDFDRADRCSLGGACRGS